MPRNAAQNLALINQPVQVNAESFASVGGKLHFWWRAIDNNHRLLTF
jgi:hypothetical protein